MVFYPQHAEACCTNTAHKHQFPGPTQAKKASSPGDLWVFKAVLPPSRHLARRAPAAAAIQVRQQLGGTRLHQPHQRLECRRLGLGNGRMVGFGQEGASKCVRVGGWEWSAPNKRHS
jgi:hypothetical protein